MRTLSLFAIAGLLLTLACTSINNKSLSKNTTSVNLPEILAKGIATHGGLDRWNEMKTMEYTIQRNNKPETHLIDLKNRKVLLTSEDYKLGFDGKEVWVSPDKAAFGSRSARFYHNLVFYFYAMPFVLADPGINYEALPDKALMGKTYKAVKITYNDGVGDAPEDYYIAHFDPSTGQMEWLLYTVTYFSGTTNEKFNALHYQWEEVNGLKLPKLMTGYKYADGKVGEKRYERPFTNASMKSSAPDQAIFEMPGVAEIDSLISH